MACGIVRKAARQGPPPEMTDVAVTSRHSRTRVMPAKPQQYVAGLRSTIVSSNDSAGRSRRPARGQASAGGSKLVGHGLERPEEFGGTGSQKRSNEANGEKRRRQNMERSREQQRLAQWASRTSGIFVGFYVVGRCQAPSVCTSSPVTTHASPDLLPSYSRRRSACTRVRR